jgi:hypothetical protein
VVADHGPIGMVPTFLVIVSTALIVIDSLLFAIIVVDVYPKIKHSDMMAIIIVGIVMTVFFLLVVNVVKFVIVTIYAQTPMITGFAMNVLT